MKVFQSELFLLLVRFSPNQHNYLPKKVEQLGFHGGTSIYTTELTHREGHTHQHSHTQWHAACCCSSSEPKIATYAQKIRFSTFDPDMFPALGRPPGAGH